MKINNLLPKFVAVLIVIIVFSSCKEDLTSLGSEVLGNQTPTGILDDSQTVVAYNQKMGAVQTNRLPAYRLGIYNDYIFGKSSSNLLSQLTLAENNPKFGSNAVVDSVFLYLPYFSKATTVDSTTTYALDSIYGNQPINISVFQSNYFLRNYDPESDFEDIQNYYSDQGSTFEEFLGEELLQVENFKPSAEGFVLNKGEKTEQKITPGLRVKLPIEYFQQKIVAMEGTPELRNNNNFTNYLRGLYLKVDSPTEEGNLFIFDATKAYVAIHYSFDKVDEPGQRDKKIFKLNFGGVNVNTFSNQFPEQIQTAITEPNMVTGDANLYLHGGEGIGTVVELFGKDLDGNGVADELEELRDKKYLINEANLIFYVNKNLMSGSNKEPERIIVYNLKSNEVLVDYNMDITNSLEPQDAFTTHLGKLKRGSDGNGAYYELRITNHISNLINRDSINVPLGIFVTQNVKTKSALALKSPQDVELKKVPSGTVVSPEGTILYGNDAANGDKRLKLQIYYTETK